MFYSRWSAGAVVRLSLVEAWQRKESRLLSEHNEQVSQLNDQLHERELQIKQYETDLQVQSHLSLGQFRRR